MSQSIRVHRLILSFIFLFCICSQTFAEPKVLRGQSFSVSGFRVAKSDIEPYLYPGYEAVVDKEGYVRLNLAIASLAETYGLKPYRVSALFFAVKELQGENNIRFFQPIWGVNSSNRAIKLYQKNMGLPFVSPDAMSVRNTDDVWQKVNIHRGAKAKGSEVSSFNVDIEIQKLSEEYKPNFSNIGLIGKHKDKSIMTKETLAYRFTKAEITKLVIDADKGSPLQLINLENHIYSIASDDHVALLYIDSK